MITDTEILALQVTLKDLREELVALIRSVKSETKIVELDSSIGRLTRIDAIQQQKMEQAKCNGLEGRLGAIDAALKRIEDGDYGDCAECGEEISSRRLKNSPEIPFCLECQSQKEASR